MAHLPLRAVLAIALVALAIVFVVTRPGATRGARQAPPASLATYDERAPHVLSQISSYGVAGSVRGEPSAPPALLAPLSPAAFDGPVAAYRAFADRQLGLMERQIARLQSALAAGDRGGAQIAWRDAFARYLELGAVYLQGPVAHLNLAIDGNAGGLAGGTASRRFSGLHRLELGLWTGAPLASLVPWAQELAVDVHELRRVLPHVSISPVDYATRAHEILEDAVRDFLSGVDVPWSHEGVLGTDAGITATKEVVATLRPLLNGREGVLPVVNAQLATLQAAVASIQAAHGGRVPTDSELTQKQSELLEGAIGGALEALAQVPGALETAPTTVIPQIPAAAARIAP
jgi:iron uptake system EfeUOB component EfeO/EfeM